MSFKGTEANLNNALDELVYTPTLNHNDLVGSEVLTILISDLGGNGSEVLNDSATISVEIAAINDYPDISFANANPATDENTPLIINGDDAITVADDAEANKVIQVTFSPAMGIFSY